MVKQLTGGGQQVLKILENMTEAWRNWDAEELEQQYSPSFWSKRASPEEVVNAHIENVEKASKSVRHLLSKPDVSYGTTKGQKMDIYQSPPATQSLGAPIFAFIHGGYWQMMTKQQGCFLVAPLISATNCTFITIEYDLAPEATMSEIVYQVQTAAKQIIQIAKKNRSRGVYFAGHSAGAHLAAMITISDWLQADKEGLNLIKGYICISGIYDLRPLIGTTANDPIKMTGTDAVENSPLFHGQQTMGKVAQNCQLIIVAGENDSPEFKRQSQEYYEMLQQLRLNTAYTVIPNVDHFNILENLGDEHFSLMQKIIRLMKNDA